MKTIYYFLALILAVGARAGLEPAPAGPGTDTTAPHLGMVNDFVGGTITNLILQGVTIRTANGNNFLQLTGNGTILIRQNDGDVLGSLNSLANEGPYGGTDRLPVTSSNYWSGTWVWDNTTQGTFLNRSGITTPLLTVATNSILLKYLANNAGTPGEIVKLGADGAWTNGVNDAAGNQALSSVLSNGTSAAGQLISGLSTVTTTNLTVVNTVTTAVLKATATYIPTAGMILNNFSRHLLGNTSASVAQIGTSEGTATDTPIFNDAHRLAGNAGTNWTVTSKITGASISTNRSLTAFTSNTVGTATLGDKQKNNTGYKQFVTITVRVIIPPQGISKLQMKEFTTTDTRTFSRYEQQNEGAAAITNFVSLWALVNPGAYYKVVTNSVGGASESVSPDSMTCREL